MIPIPVALFVLGTVCLSLGLWPRLRIIKAAHEYRPESQHPSARQAADRGAGLALAHTWFLIALGLGAFGFALYLWYKGAFI